MNFNAAHLHLLVNHFPVEGVMFGVVLLVSGMARRSEEWMKAAMMVFILAGIAAVAAFLTGQSAAHLMLRLPGISRAAVHAHSNAAGYALTGASILGLFCLLGWYGLTARHISPWPRWFAPTCLLLSLIVTGLMAWTAYKGGEIRHPEARPGFHFPAPGPRQPPREAAPGYQPK